MIWSCQIARSSLRQLVQGSQAVAQVRAAAFDKRGGIFGAGAGGDQDRGLGVAPGRLQRRPGGLGRGLRDPGDDPLGAGDELGVVGNEVDHHAVVDVAHQAADTRRDHVERHLLRRTCAEAGRAFDHLGCRGDCNGDVGQVQKRGRADIRDADDRQPCRAGGPGRGQREGRGAAGAEHQRGVAGAEALRGGGAVVHGILGRAGHPRVGRDAARHADADAFGRDAEGAGQLAGVRQGHQARAAGRGVKQRACARQRGGNRPRCGFKGRACGPDGAQRGGVRGQHPVQRLRRRQSVDGRGGCRRVRCAVHGDSPLMQRRYRNDTFCPSIRAACLAVAA